MKEATARIKINKLLEADAEPILFCQEEKK